MSIALYGSQLGIPSIDRDHAILIAARIMNGAEAQDFEIDPRATLPPEVERSVSSLVRYQMQFTFGHEYAHLLGGHLSSPGDSIDKALPVTKGSTLESLRIYSHGLEYQADLYALKNIQQAPKNQADVGQGAFSVLLYLHFLHTVWKELGLQHFSVSETHPSALNRLERLFQGLGKQSPVSEDDLEKSIGRVNEMSDHFVRLLESGRDDALTFYGSVYLPSYTSKLKRDRIDF